MEELVGGKMGKAKEGKEKRASALIF